MPKPDCERMDEASQGGYFQRLLSGYEKAWAHNPLALKVMAEACVVINEQVSKTTEELWKGLSLTTP